MNKNQGFTLIELLVVVLIIGILSAAALPQYQKAVIKTHVVRLLPLVRSISDAENLHYLANDQYTMDFSELSIEMPSGAEQATATTIAYRDFVCYLHAEEGKANSVYCNSTYANAPQLEKYFRKSQFICWPRGNAVAVKVCQSLSGKSAPDAGSNSNITGYYF